VYYTVACNTQELSTWKIWDLQCMEFLNLYHLRIVEF
jgi:hypothetical protein